MIGRATVLSTTSTVALDGSWTKPSMAARLTCGKYCSLGVSTQVPRSEPRISPPIQSCLLRGVSVRFMITLVMPRHTPARSAILGRVLRNSAEVTGTTVTATISDTNTANAMVSERSAKSWPSTSFRKMTGRKIATLVAVEASSAPQT